jgi:hypothetical protein
MMSCRLLLVERRRLDRDPPRARTSSASPSSPRRSRHQRRLSPKFLKNSARLLRDEIHSRTKTENGIETEIETEIGTEIETEKGTGTETEIGNGNDSATENEMFRLGTRPRGLHQAGRDVLILRRRGSESSRGSRDGQYLDRPSSRTWLHRIPYSTENLATSQS